MICTVPEQTKINQKEWHVAATLYISSWPEDKRDSPEIKLMGNPKSAT
jgi:hypothetical protein